jgi:S1-C subfamily serine protease
VVDQATKIQVQLNGETQKYPAKVIGVDEETDWQSRSNRRTYGS